MLGGPPLCTREPAHSASRGPPVQMLIVVRLMAHTSARRWTRRRSPPGRRACSSIAVTLGPSRLTWHNVRDPRHDFRGVVDDAELVEVRLADLAGRQGVIAQ